MLTQLTDQVYVLPGGVNIGVVRIDDRRCILIDSGLNDTPGRKAIRAVREELGSEIVAIVTTHGHADHFGGNAIVVKRTGARVYAPAMDEAILRYPILQPAFLFGGADPVDSLRNGFMLADPSPVDAIYGEGPVEIDGCTLTAISLAGHSANQMGIRVDGVFFSADVVLPETVLEKYRIPYLYSVTDHLEAMERCAEVSCYHVVPGHGPLSDNIEDLREQNLRIVRTTLDLAVECCIEPRTGGEVMTYVLDHSGANVSDATSYYLLQPTIFAYLSHLTRTGDLVHRVEANSATWVRA